MTIKGAANYGDEKYLYSIVSSSVDAANGSTWGLDYTSANFFPFFHKNLGDESGNPKKPFPNESGMMACGEFYVPADRAGVWSFLGCYDDYVSIYVDGAKVFSVTTKCATGTGSTTLTPGWHRWEVRVQDGSGGWGPQNNVNGGNTLSYIAPGEQEKQFNETNLKLAATLGDISVLERTGIYRELDLGENATLVSLGTVTMPIFGTLKGKGTLEGPFVFDGPTSAWEVEGTAARSILTSCAVFSSATPDTYKGLARVKALFDKRPLNAAYVLANAPAGLTSADLAAVATTVTDAEGNDYSDAFSVRVKDGKVVLANARPSGMTIFVR